jgi:phosphoribosylformylglycinamidine synthase
LAAERRNGDFVRGQIQEGRVRACHDVSDGGLLVAVAEMALAGGVGARLLTEPAGVAEHAFWFGEDQGRYVLAVADSSGFLQSAAFAGVPAIRIGQTAAGDLTVSDGDTISLDVLRATHERFFPAWMDGPAA